MLDCYKNARLPELEKELARMKKKLAKFDFNPELNGMAKRSTRIAVRNHGMSMMSNLIDDLDKYIKERKRELEND